MNRKQIDRSIFFGLKSEHFPEIDCCNKIPFEEEEDEEEEEEEEEDEEQQEEEQQYFYEEKEQENKPKKEQFQMTDEEKKLSEIYDIDYEDERVHEHFRRTFCDDPVFLRKYGPINPLIPDEYFNQKCLNSKNGICAMMTCKCHDYNEEEDTIDDWYTGKCEKCSKEIEKHQAFRVPLSVGGFEGCLCSKECAHELYYFDPYAEEHILIELMSIYIDGFPISIQR